MFKNIQLIFGSLILLLFLSSCRPEKRTLEVKKIPIEGGEVIPSAGKYEYDKGKDVKITAMPNDDWIFDGWSGSTSSSDNPVTIAMDEDRTITANFIPDDISRPTFSVEIPITDGVHSQTVELVSDDDVKAQNGLDSKDREGPPVAPPGVFFTGSVVDDMNLYTDVRQAASNIVWELRLNRPSGETITLEDWSISKSDIGGSLMLVDDPNDPTPDIEQDMQSASSFSVSDPSIQRLYVVYEQDASSKVITDISTMGKELEVQEKVDPSMDRLKEGVWNSNEANQLHQKNQ